MEFWNSIWNIIAVIFTLFFFMAALFTFIAVASDLFRDRQLSGGGKAIWILFLVIFPLLTALIYIIARGNGMAERAAKEQNAAKQATESYIREVAGSSPADEIAKAKSLLDAGAISAEEFEALKQKALTA